MLQLRALLVLLGLLLVVPALAVNGSLAEQRSCIYSSFPSVFSSCSSVAGSSSGRATRDELIKLLHRCTGVNRGAQQVVRIYAPLSNFAFKVQPLTKTYAKLLGITINIPMFKLNLMNQVFEDMIKNAANFTITQEAWLSLGQYHIGDVVDAGSLRTLTDLVTLDQRLNWVSFLPVLREAGLLYKSEVIGLPFNSYTRHLMYRKDMFAKYNITVPRTWRELLSFGRAWNGTEGMHAVCLHFGNCYGGLGSGMWEIMSSYFQTHGYKNPALLDPDTMELLLDNEAMAEALDVYKALLAISPPDDSEARLCPLYPYRFAAGQCMTTVAMSLGYKLMSHKAQAGMGAVRGKTGYAFVPGSEHVYNRQTKKLVPCDSVLCPHATKYKNADGTTTLINHTPWLGLATYNLNAYSPPDLAFYTFSIVAYLTSEQVANQFLLEPATEFAPTRTTQLNPTTWIAAGYDEQDTYEFLRSFNASLEHPNFRYDMRLKGGLGRNMMWFGPLGQNLFNTTSAQWIKIATQIYNRSLMASFDGNTTAMKMDYWASLNREWPRPQPPPPVPVPSLDNAFAPTHQTGSPGMDASVIVPSLVIPICALACAAFFLYRYTALLKGGWSTVEHPGPGPMTTLLVTDIENSTNYWEMFSPQVMDVTLKLHNTCIRRLAAKHGGYESVWEGDSFIIAFHSPAAALHFCMEVQQELLSLPWPKELLQSDFAGEVWCVLDKSSDKDACDDLTLDRGIPAHTPVPLPRSLSTLYAAPTLHSVWEGQWQRCSAGTDAAVLAYRGLRVRLGLHAGVADASAITFNKVMQRYHYTGPVRVVSNAVASAGHGGYTLMSTDTAALLDSDKTGVLTDLPEHCNVYYWGRHILSGVGEPQQLLLMLPVSLACRLALQESKLRSDATKTSGIWACPVPSPAADTATALAYVQFTGLSTLMAWDAAETSKALQVAWTCIQETLAACNGALSEDGLSSLLDPAASKSTRRGSFPDSTVRGRVVCIFSAPTDTSRFQRNPAVAFALAVRDRLLTEDWSDRLLSHELAEQVGTLAIPWNPLDTQTEQPPIVYSNSDSPTPILQSLVDDASLVSRGTNDRALTIPASRGPRNRVTFDPEAISPRASHLRASNEGSMRSTRQSGNGSEGDGRSLPSRDKSGFSFLASALHQTLSRSLGKSFGSVARECVDWHGAEDRRSEGVSAKHVVVQPVDLRGPRFKMVVVDARGAMYTVATRSSGLVVFSGAPEKRAAKLMGRAKPGEVVVDRSLMIGNVSTH